MARNMMCDHRVNCGRAAGFHADFASRSVYPLLENAITAYQLERVRQREPPDFLDDVLNHENLLTSVDQDLELVTILDLSGLVPIYRWARSNPDPAYDAEITRIGPLVDQTSVNAWLNVRLPAAAPTLVPSALAVLRASRAAGVRHHPVWAVPWRQLASLLKRSKPDRWLEVVGKRVSTAGRWLITLRYKTKEAGTIVRPTVLEAGWHSQHFPSPRTLPPGFGGCCMDLRTYPKAQKLVFECIHQQFDFTPKHWYDSGALCAKTTRAGRAHLRRQRQAHHDLLYQNCPGVLTWMPNCV